MKAIGYYPDLDPASKNEMAVLLAAAGVHHVVCQTKDEVFHEIQKGAPQILLTNEEHEDIIEHFNSNLRDTLIIVLVHSHFQKILDVATKCSSIKSLVALNGLDQDARDIVTLLRKYATGRIFGVEKYLRNETVVHELSIADPVEKETALTAVASSVLSLGANIETNRFEVYARRVRELLDELILNAIFDANPRLQENMRQTNFHLEEDECVKIRWGFDGVIFGISVIDPFGTLQRDTILQYLSHSTVHMQNADGKENGGMGLQLVFSKVHQFIVNVAPSKKTEVVCLMKFENRLKDFDSRLKSFHYFQSTEEARTTV